MRRRGFLAAPYIPLGQCFPPTVWRDPVAGQWKGARPVFWNLAKA